MLTSPPSPSLPLLDKRPTPLSAKYAAAIVRFKYFVIAFWVVLVALSVFPALSFTGATNNNITPPKHTASAKASAALQHMFPESAKETQLVVLVDTPDGSKLHLPTVDAFFTALEDALAPYRASGQLLGFQSHASLDARNLTLLADQMVSQDGSSSYAAATVVSHTSVQGLLSFAEAQARALLPAAYRMGMTGFPVFTRDSQRATEQMMSLMDSAALPLALCVLAYILRCIRMLLLPLVAIGCAVACSFACMYYVAGAMDVISFVPSTMLSLTIALSIDFNLFELSRFREEVLRTKQPGGLAVITTILQSSGHTILISGSTLCVCFLGLCIFPVSLMQSSGIGAALAIVWMLLINLSLTPAILAVWSPFFAAPFLHPVTYWERVQQAWSFVRCRGCVLPRRAARSTAGASRSASTSSAVTPPPPPPPDVTTRLLSSPSDTNTTLGAALAVNGSDCASLAPKHDPVADANARAIGDDVALLTSCWYRGTRFLLRQAPWVLAVAVACVAPLAYYAVDFKTTVSFLQVTASGSESARTFEKLSQEFSAGAMTPYKLLIAPQHASVSVLTDDFVTDAGAACATMVDALPFMQHHNVLGLVCSKGPTGFTAVPWPYVQASLANVTQPCSDLAPTQPLVAALCPYLRAAAQDFVNQDASATLVELELEVDPFSFDGRHWLDVARQQVAALRRTYPHMKFYLVGAAAEFNDGADAVMDDFPLMITVTCVVVVAIMCLAFRSVPLALMTVVTISVTLLWIYGWATLVYQYGVFDRLHWRGLRGQGAEYWFSPLMSFSVAVGLSLDYSTFTINRMAEFRRDGHSTRLSILRGVFMTGRVVTAAGVVMALAFGALLFSVEPALVQIGFFLCFSVLFDTFVVRSILVPPIMGLLGRLVWWPGTMPPVQFAAVGGVPEHDLNLVPQLCRTCYNRRRVASPKAVGHPDVDLDLSGEGEALATGFGSGSASGSAPNSPV